MLLPGFRKSLVVAVIAVSAMMGGAQSSKDGSVQGRTFTDRHFHIAFDLPPGFNPRPLSALSSHASEADGYPMLMAQEGSAPYGIVLIAQRLQTGPNKVRSAVDFLNRVRNSRVVGDVVGARGHQATTKGLVFDWLDWNDAEGGFDAAVVTQRGDYLLAAKCNARSVADLQVMKDALFGMRIIGD